MIARWDSQPQTANVSTGDLRRYCVLGQFEKLVWSSDSRYLAVQVTFSDNERHLLIVDVDSGYMVDLMTDIYDLITWGQDPGTYYSGAVQTPTPIGGQP